MRISRKKTKPVLEKRYFYNEQIRVPEVRVIGQDGANLGLLKTHDATAQARALGLDLVLIDPTLTPPVAKFLSYGQFKYQKEKELRKMRAQSKTTEVKGVRITPRIGIHDLEVRRNQAIKFLERGDKVQVELIMHGRDQAHKDLMTQQVQSFINELNKVFPIRIEQPISKQGNKFIALVARE